MKNTRGIDVKFAKMFMVSKLYTLYKEHRDELFIGVRNGYINLYYKAKSIAKVTVGKRNGLKCEIAKKYLYGDGKGNEKGLDAKRIYDSYNEIKSVIDKENSSDPEKTAQQQLVLNNNANTSSDWYCIDIEYVRQRSSNKEKILGRFDIIAVSKKRPYRVALIELKYGSSAFGGTSGIYKHASDFAGFMERDYYKTHLREEIIRIIQSRKMLTNDCPLKISDKNNLADRPEFYFITLDCAKKGERSTPKQSMAGYVFNKQNPKASLHNARKTAKKNVEDEFGDITDPENKRLYAKFLFSDDTIENLTIDDIIDGEYDRDF